MQEIKTYNQSDLVLKVNNNYNPDILNLDDWELYLDILTEGREYQKEAIKTSIIYLTSGQYESIEDLVEENFGNNDEIQSKYTSLDKYIDEIQLPKKLYGNIDLATGTGKSYVIYGIAQIMLSLGLVDRVLVLCPSVTIENELIEKFIALSSSDSLKETIPNNARLKNPRIITANETILPGDICVENIHAVYEGTGSSIEDSLHGNGRSTLVLNDESHHIFNKLHSISGRSRAGQNIKKWKEFLLDKKYNFKYILGFTGTAYLENEYFNDVIFRYSLSSAIEDRVVKNINYIQRDESAGDESEKLQKIYQNHQRNSKKYPLIKPLTILVTKDINDAKVLEEKIIEFLVEIKNKKRDDIENKVLTVTSSPDHVENVLKLKDVDRNEDPTEWIISVSMLTEGWDVKNVFQIVPWHSRAFNSKLLIAQVLGRGLRIPKEYSTPQPKVIVFNHDSWSRNIRRLIDEVLEIETRINSTIIHESERTKYNFKLKNLNYDRVETQVEQKKENKSFDYSRIEKEGIKLDSQVTEAVTSVEYGSILDEESYMTDYNINYRVIKIDEVINKIYEEFKIRDWEGKVLKLGANEYTQKNLPPKSKIKQIIRQSMDKVGIESDFLVEKNAQRIYQAFSTLLRKKSKTIISELKALKPYSIDTKDMGDSSISLSSLRKDAKVFYSSRYKDEIHDKAQQEIIERLSNKSDDNEYYQSLKEINHFLFKTPTTTVITQSKPERLFVEKLIENSQLIDSWIKSRDSGFYSIEYSLRYGSKNSNTRKYKIKSFNPDFFIRVKKCKTYTLVIEIKDDQDITLENQAKYFFAKRHFDILNEQLKKHNINEKYIFHFLSPNAYIEFFDYINSGLIFEGKFKCELENLLEESTN